VAPDPKFTPEQAGLPLTRWILDAASAAAVEATAALEAYRFDEYAAVCYRFTWNTFCDWFVEFAKPALAAPTAPSVGSAAHRRACPGHRAAPAAPGDAVRHRGALGPFRLRSGEQPDPRGLAGTLVVPGAAEARVELDWVVRLITEVRTVRAEMNVPPSQKAPLLLKGAAPEALARGHAWFERSLGWPAPPHWSAGGRGAARRRAGDGQRGDVVIPLAG